MSKNRKENGFVPCMIDMTKIWNEDIGPLRSIVIRL